MKWKLPPKIKIYEALGCIADNRLEIDGDTGKVYSSSRGKYYTIVHNPSKNALMVNDNGSYHLGYLWYPAVAFLMRKWLLELSEEHAHALRWIHWKDLNVKYDKNRWEWIPDYDFDAVIHEIHKTLKRNWLDIWNLKTYIAKIEQDISHLWIHMLWEKMEPPKGY